MRDNGINAWQRVKCVTTARSQLRQVPVSSSNVRISGNGVVSGPRSTWRFWPWNRGEVGGHDRERFSRIVAIFKSETRLTWFVNLSGFSWARPAYTLLYNMFFLAFLAQCFSTFLLQRPLPQMFALLMEPNATIHVSVLLSVINLCNSGIATTA